MKTGSTVGFIGLGRMGGAMARRLLRAGYAVVGCDPDAAAREAFQQAGGHIAAIPCDVADSAEVVLACLPGAGVSRSVAFGADGVAGGKAVRVYVETSTVGQAVMEDIASRLSASGIGVLDAPISGGPDGADAGTLAAVVSGAREAQALARPIMAAYASTVVDAGPQPGMAQVFKLVNQGLTFASFALTAEAVSAGVKAGADPQALLDFLNAGTSRNWATAVKFPQSVLPRKFGPGNLDIVKKDMALYLELCRQTGTPALLGQQADAIFSMAERVLPAPVDLASIVRFYENTETK
jgi:3-hydroxyisobutyrate dehydrogenase-like beta-hydroxyacid dehydrogenase